MWTLGALACMHLAAYRIPYWLNILMTALCCYTALFVFVIPLTPILDVLGKGLTRSLWQVANKSPPRDESYCTLSLQICWRFTIMLVLKRRLKTLMWSEELGNF